MAVTSSGTNFGHTYPIAFSHAVCPMLTRIHDTGSGINPSVIRTYNKTGFTMNNGSNNGFGFAYVAIG